MSTNGTRLVRGQGWVLGLTSAASLMVSLDSQVVVTALPAIRLHPHASLAALEWTVNADTLSFAVLAGPVVSGAVTQGLVWPWVFWLNVPIGLVMIPLVLAKIKTNSTERAGSRVDPVGLLLATGGALSRLFRSRSVAAGNAVVFCVFAVVLAMVFCMAQYLQTGSPETFVNGFGPAMAACAGLALLGAGAGLIISGRHPAALSVLVQSDQQKIEIRS